ncbi:hypothetical protein [Chryseobacterium jejuense]|uniref:hypothetical protein n=1 Tax=Chryseobacterium jejuense TaxID=445960 RepID=UPI001AE73A05|nr:hypothetical protein [Chryseobacterium jejuense]MBP2616962.1 hypothetical protein [Chryseobacterium jejuense]
MRVYFFIIIFALYSCSKGSKNSSVSNYYTTEASESESNYGDSTMNGTYCAEIDYYYYNTGTSSTYTLTVEVENDELVKINWPNGGWLDDSHFTPQDISSGSCSFTSDAGYDYNITLLNKGDCSYSTTPSYSPEYNTSDEYLDSEQETSFDNSDELEEE